MKYFLYLSILLFTLFRKTFGLVWFWVAVPFRKYARNVIYNYVLQNGIFLKRLLERPITHLHIDLELTEGKLITIGWEITPYHGSNGGFIKYRKISLVEYQLVLWLIWGWLDDDSNYDTFSSGYNQTLINRERKKWLPNFIIERLKETEESKGLYGNSFDLGDMRGEDPQFGFWASYLWTIRNTAYNFNYMFLQTNYQPFFVEWKGLKFGWEYDNDLNGIPTYNFKFIK